MHQVTSPFAVFVSDGAFWAPPVASSSSPPHAAKISATAHSTAARRGMGIKVPLLSRLQSWRACYPRPVGVKRRRGLVRRPRRSTTTRRPGAPRRGSGGTRCRLWPAPAVCRACRRGGPRRCEALGRVRPSVTGEIPNLPSAKRAMRQTALEPRERLGGGRLAGADGAVHVPAPDRGDLGTGPVDRADRLAQRRAVLGPRAGRHVAAVAPARPLLLGPEALDIGLGRA